MPSNSVVINPLTARDVRAAARVLTGAFRDDPFMAQCMSASRRRRFAAAALFRGEIWAGLAQGTVLAARVDGRLAGVAIWLPPHPPQPHGSYSRRSAAAKRLVMCLFPRGSRTLYRAFEKSASMVPAEPHWYLAFLGVDERLQGGGIGRALVEHVLRLADNTGHTCYLETPFPQTHPFYSRLGFAITSEVTLYAGAPPMWTLLRPARPVPEPLESATPG